MLRYARAQAGIALIVVLVFMQILAMLSWCAMANVLLAVKASEAAVERHQLFQRAFQLLQQSEVNLIAQLPHCLIPQDEPNNLTAKPLDWWYSSLTCTGNFREFKYYYVVEPLGDDPCASIEHAQATAAYFRMTLLFSSSSGNARLFLQSTVIRPSDLRQLCQGTHHLVEMGRQSWRELD